MRRRDLYTSCKLTLHVQGGEIIRELRQETGTKIKIEDPTPDCEDRVVTIIGPDRHVILRHSMNEQGVSSARHQNLVQYIVCQKIVYQAACELKQPLFDPDSFITVLVQNTHVMCKSQQYSA